MADALVTQARVRMLMRESAESGTLFQTRVRAAYQLPAEETNMSQARIRGFFNGGNEVEISQGRVRAIVRGRTELPHVRAWTFTLDGHDFYVVRLGNDSTLLYDTQTEQFTIWGSNEGTVWRAYTGINWLGGYRQAAAFGSNVTVGDDGNGAIYMLDPEGDRDDDALVGGEVRRPYKRIASGQVAHKGYTSARCYGVQLQGSIGDFHEDLDPDVVLEYSDDRGATYTESTTYTLTPGEYGARLNWRSLGAIRAPGRIFRVKDYGALRRIDSLDMPGNNDEER